MIVGRTTVRIVLGTAFAMCLAPPARTSEIPLAAQAALARTSPGTEPAPAVLDESTRAMEAAMARAYVAVQPIPAETLALALPRYRPHARAIETIVQDHELDGIRYTLAGRTFESSGGRLEVDLVDTTGAPFLVAPFAVRHEVARLGLLPEGRATVGRRGERMVGWRAGERRVVEVLLGQRILVRLTAPVVVSWPEIRSALAQVPIRRLVQIVDPLLLDPVRQGRDLG